LGAAGTISIQGMPQSIAFIVRRETRDRAIWMSKQKVRFVSNI
jgi:hypothetical protein